MLKGFARLLLWLSGWRIKGSPPEGIAKCVLILAPHTSNWDFVIGRLVFIVYGISPKVLIKKEIFKPVLGPVLKWLGGIPVDRGRSNNMVGNLAKLFEKSESLYLVITPEGTRKYNPNWKKGFYYIAIEAGVPIVLGYLDYKTKEGGIAEVFYPTNDFDKDFEEIQTFYRSVRAKYPEKYSLSAHER